MYIIIVYPLKVTMLVETGNCKLPVGNSFGCIIRGWLIILKKTYFRNLFLKEYTLQLVLPETQVRFLIAYLSVRIMSINHLNYHQFLDLSFKNEKREERSRDHLLGWSLAATASKAIRGKQTDIHTCRNLFNLLYVKSNDHMGSIQQLPLTVVTNSCLEGIFELVSFQTATAFQQGNKHLLYCHFFKFVFDPIKTI